MKRTKFQWIVSITVMSILLAFSSCSGEDGLNGEVGPAGETGAQGIQGEVGPAGEDGSVIYSGEGTPEASTGIAGDYYLNATTGQLYGPKKIDDSWEAADAFSLAGKDGADGNDGADGSDGSDGNDGVDGSDGSDGNDGANGSDGADGNDGANGSDGVDGTKTLSGIVPPTNTDGEVGDFYLDKTTYTLYGPKSDRSASFPPDYWGAGLMLKGADGNANVRTFNYIVDVDSWTLGGGGAGEEINYSLPMTQLTQDVFDNGIVLVYKAQINFTGIRHPLPMIEVTDSKNFVTSSFSVNRAPSTLYFQVNFKVEIANGVDPTEYLVKGDDYYKSVPYSIKVITGSAAVTLSAYRGDNDLLMKNAERMGLLD